MLKLVNVKETYEVTYPLESEPIENRPVFMLRKLSAGEVNLIDDEITVTKGEDKFVYLGGTAARMKVRMAVVDWKNVLDDNNNPAICNDTNKELLPSEIQQFLVKRIDEDNGLRKTKKARQEEKN